MIKLDVDDGYYDASELINKKGYATLGEIAQDICNKKGLELASSSFLNSDKRVAVYDNSVKAREYMSFIGASAGGFVCAGRDGKIYIKDFGQDEIEIPLRLFKTYKFGEEYQVSRVAFEDGTRSFKFGDETRNTLWINQENMFIVDEEQVQKIYNKIKGLTINSFEGTVIIDPRIDIGDKIITGGKAILYQGEMSLNKRFIADIKSKISIKQKQETTVRKESQSVINRRIQSQIDQVEGRITQLVEETSENTQNISRHEQTINGMTNTVSSVETKVNNLQIGARNLALNTRKFFNAGRSGTIGNGLEGTPELLEDTFTPSGYCAKYQYKQSSGNAGIYLRKELILGTNEQKMKADEIYTISFYAKASTATSFSSTGIFAEDQTIITPANLNLKTEWKRFYTTFKWTNTTKLTTCFYIPQGDVTLYLSSFKLEEGNIPTDWVPAPEDIESNLESNYYTKTETESKIDQRADSITSTVSQNYSTKAETTQAKNEAINSANTATDNKLENYSTTTQMNSAITQKANEITTTVTTLENKVNNMQVGGRNLLLNSKTLSGKTGTNIDNDGFSEGYTTGNGTWNEKQYWWSVNATDNPLTGKQVCISLDFKTDDITKINKMAFSIGTYASNKTTRRGDYNLYVTSYKTIDGSDLENNKWTRIYCVATIPSSFTHSDARYYALQTKIAYDAGTPTMYYKKIKIELGNKPTDWSPAPEDIESNLEDNYYTKTETESKIQQKADEITSTVSTVETKLNNLQIGGTNLLRGTNIITALTNQGTWSNGTWRSAGGGTGTRTSISVSDAPNANIKVGWSTSSTSGQVLISQDNVPMTNGEKYTLSCYAKGTGSILLQYGNGTVGYMTSNIQITDANNWKKYSYTFTSKGTANIYIGSNSAGNDVSFCGIKLEKGNVATDWSPAPEDIESNLITNYYTKTETETKIDQKADNITSTVNKTISNIQTGTENLLLNTAIKENTNNWTLASGITRTTSKTTPNGNYCFYYNISGLTSNSWRCANPAYVSVQPGEILTADVNVFIPSSNDIDGEVALEIQYFNSSRTRIGYLKKLIDTTVVDKWQKATVTLEAPTNAAYANARVWVLKNGKFYVGDLILSRGNTSASWAPSSNDYTAKTELGTLIEQNWEHIKVAWNQISQYLQLEGTNGSASLNIYNQSNNKLMTLNANGETYYNGSGNEIGKIGIIRQNNKDILAFSMPVDWNNISSSRSMAWGIFDPNNNFLPIFYLAGLYGANNSEYEGQLVVAGGLSAQDIELEQGIIKASIGGFQVLNNNDQVMLSVLKNGSGSSTYFNLLDLISTWYNTTVGCHYLDFHNNRLANLGNVPVSETNDPNLIKVINNIGGFDDSYIYASFKNGGDVFVYSNSSDRNLKKNIKETNISAIELIQKINHVQFDWKSNERHQSIGYIAQEMQEVEESFVHHSKYKDKEDWQINTLSVLATATKAIQEQQEIIEDLKSRIEKLEKEVNK